MALVRVFKTIREAFKDPKTGVMMRRDVDHPVVSVSLPYGKPIKAKEQKKSDKDYGLFQLTAVQIEHLALHGFKVVGADGGLKEPEKRDLPTEQE